MSLVVKHGTAPIEDGSGSILHVIGYYKNRYAEAYICLHLKCYRRALGLEKVLKATAG